MSKSLITLKPEKDMAIITSWLSLLFLISGLIAYYWASHILFGVLAGIAGILSSYLLIFSFTRINFVKKNVLLYSWLKWFIRLGIMAIILSISIWIINPNFNDNLNTSRVELLWEPINIIMLIFTYTIPVYSAFLLPLYEKIKKKYVKSGNRNS